MEVICFALGIIIGAGAGGTCAFFVMKNTGSKKELEIFEEKRKEEQRKEKQMANFWAYDGTTKGQEEID